MKGNRGERRLPAEFTGRSPEKASGERPPGEYASAPRARSVEAASHEEDIGLNEIWRILRRQAWIVFTALVVVVGGVAFHTFRQTPIWEASALLRMEEKQIDPFEQQGLSGGRGELATEMRVVTTYPIVSEVVDRYGLHFRLVEPAGVPRDRFFSEVQFDRSAPSGRYEILRRGEDRYAMRVLRPENGEIGESRIVTARVAVSLPGGWFILATDAELREAGFAPAERLVIVTMDFEAAVRAAQGALSVLRADPNASLFRISYRSPDRLLAREVADAVAEEYMAQRQGVQKTEARSTVAFLREQTAQIQEQLEEAEAGLRQFRETERVVALEAEARAQVTRLAQLQAQRSELAAERDALRKLLESIRISSPEARPDYRRLVAFPTFLQNQTVQGILQSLNEAEQRRTELRERWRPSHPGIVALDELIVELEERLGGIGRNYLQSLEDQIASRDAVLDRFGEDLLSVPGRELEFARLSRQTELLTDLHSFLQQRLKEAEVREAVEDPTVRVVEPALLPLTPVSPKKRRNMMFGGFLGLILGMGLAFVCEHMDKAIHADDDVDQLLGLPVLSRIPSLPSAANGSGSRGPSRQEALVTSVAARSLPAESYRTLRTNVTYSHWENGGGGREMVITSPGAKDGKSVTASNLAVTFAQQGRKVLLVDADMRKSVQHRIFEVERLPGLSDFLVGRATFEDVVRTTKIPNLHLLPSGITPPNPSELLGSPLTDYLLQKAREEYEAVIFDSPPALAVTDAAVLAGKMDGVLLVVRAERTHREAAQDLISQLRRLGAHVLGVVVNDTKGNGRYGYRYRYYYEYYGEDAQEPPGYGARGKRSPSELIERGASESEEG